MISWVCVYGRQGRLLAVLFVAAMAAYAAAPACAQQGTLQTIRDDVRAPPAASSGGGSSWDLSWLNTNTNSCDPSSDPNSNGSGSLLLAGLLVTPIVATAPVWGPHGALGDNFSVLGYFPRYPYDRVPGYMLMGDAAMEYDPGLRASVSGPTANPGSMTIDGWKLEARYWAGRLDVEYGKSLDDLDRIGAHLLLSTTSRFGIDAQWNYLEERRPGGRLDHLQLGDCNLIYRFAQSPKAEFRLGLGCNYLTDQYDSNFGFNFNYAADFFPVDPWVISTSIDWGTLGSTGLFRGRATVGAVYHGVEAYTGYEFLEIGGASMNNLIAGVRIWF